jgi:hypothetical protein
LGFGVPDHLLPHNGVPNFHPGSTSFFQLVEDLRQRILAVPDVLESGLHPMMTERETSAGAVDIYGKDVDGTPTIVELKRRRVGPDAVGQLNRYVDALELEGLIYQCHPRDSDECKMVLE